MEFASIPGPVPSPSVPTPEGFLMLFTDDWYLVEAANRFSMEVRYKPLKTKRWQNTQRATAQDLGQWWTFIAANEIKWERADSEDLSDYANLMAETVSPATSLQFSTSTVRRRVNGVVTFYEWAQKKGLVEVTPQYEVQSVPAQIPIGPEAAFLP